ncbi:non-hydrolyzing UDP-N-acetylglucosamine 2-epimerase [Nocardioides cavernaquae]|uniref:UDP-N-acetylglucosamine 2-epimerase (Non-hydrolyzing) n=1 Tax=Nocardioides cavernaquae TaxID=2321396 RepID=A0A3A5H6E5_9ACTN|nr:UDP-N-acetylglucosamine 2-epimerase (non-hydrolyzing) [Nocardioides cavernaquae]RJS46259.1 UDP-N-acetylglucosamine 2-epimerase (non-hydrolyzing) [Nocardioides cavernaquae]
MSHLVVHITGARPNFPKAAPVIDALARQAAAAGQDVRQVLVHTGQHYDERLSDVFFRQLGLPEPDVNLGVGSGSHAEQTAAVLVGLEKLFLEGEWGRPDLVVVYGDVNSTVAAALVAAKLQIPLAHVEAGLRSFDPSMPEEVNRLVTDRLADVLLCTSADAVAHLGNEGVAPERIHLVGNPMIDTLLAHLGSFDVELARKRHDLDGRYAVATLHRPANVDSAQDVQALVTTLHSVADQVEVVLPLHPRGREALLSAGLLDHDRIRLVEPLGYVEFLGLVRGADVVVTDSGGVQEETTVLGVPCLTLRPNTERPVTITHGTNRLVTRDELAARVAEVLATPSEETDGGWPVPPLWDGQAGPRIAKVLLEVLR